MKQIVISSGLSLFLIACGGSDSRYRDTALLEKPPTLVIQRTPGVSYETDESSIPKKQDPGLGKEVYLTETSPAELRLKKTADSAWNDLIKAINLNELKITDQERNKGHVYVEYDASGFFSRLGSFMKEGRKGPVYLLIVEEMGAETKITASKASSSEQSTPSSNPDGYYDKPVNTDASQDLLKTLYKTIRDDLVED